MFAYKPNLQYKLLVNILKPKVKNDTINKVKTPFLNIDIALPYRFDAKNILKELVSFFCFLDLIIVDFNVSNIVRIVRIKPETVMPIPAISFDSQLKSSFIKSFSFK
ncbi:hypothetical protein ATE92_1757 [Ulvibacter sp. MAR_2010_11]|uniref:hypothetical protein n=1 Tax=Ulvibacter sp. MAR_2010_11 TaxID=1250229 RepID=UPI000CB5AB35|nr:hypothetical protein [Ulvibacter sp. MAR_2010_11]PKA83600.1 hypothetical protein ATE92_1757 [Ulvibacter sp. MAR_2010_11]